MWPPMSSTSRLEMVRPRPVPPNWRVVDESACVKLSKMTSSLSAGMPMPVSETENSSVTLEENGVRVDLVPEVDPSTPSSKSTLTPFPTVTRRTTSPDIVNLSALPTRFRRICRRRCGSPTRSRGTSAMTLSWAVMATISEVFSMSSTRSNSTCSSVRLRASTLDKSRISLTRVRRLSPARLKIRTYSCCSFVRGLSNSRSAMPMMAFIGVRISWLMLARNSDLARFAASAISLAFCRSASACLRSVMSRATARKPSTRPSSMMTCTFWPIHISLPSLVRTGISKYVLGVCLTNCRP